MYKDKEIDKIMGQCEKLKAKLQKRGTKSAKRHLKQLSGREKRYRRNVNHCISKKLVAKAKDAGRMLVLENLKGIRNQTTVRKAQRRRHNSWGFGQLRNFIEYKAKLAGVPLALVNPRETSHMCPRCGCLDKENRVNRESFRCVSCGLAGPADYVAALNIAARGAVNRPTVSGDFFGRFGLPQGQAHEFIRG